MESISTVGLINPITVDSDLNLIAGAHRLEAFKSLGRETIKCQVCEQDDLIKNLIEVDENLIRNDLDYIGIAEHLAERERILTSLEVRVKSGDNQHTITDQSFSTDDLAEKLGISTRTYQQRRQIANLIPAARNALRGTKHARNLMDLVVLSRMEDHIQERVSELAKTEPGQNLKYLINRAKSESSSHRDRSEAYRKMQSTWGTPYSVIKFVREDNVIEDAIKTVTHSVEFREVKNIKKTGHIDGEKLQNYSGFVSHALFLLNYFVREPGSKVLDSFLGKGTNAFAAGVLNMDFYGFELNQANVDAINEGMRDFFQENDGSYGFNWQLYCDDGIALKPFKNEEEFFDAVLTDPHYLMNTTEDYGNGDDPRDLSNMSRDEYLAKIDELFANYYRLIKTSSVKEKKFYPIIIKMGTTRVGEQGIASMDFEFMKIAERHNLTLWDRTFNVYQPSTMFVAPRNNEYRYTVKNWETTCVWIKQLQPKRGEF